MKKYFYILLLILLSSCGDYLKEVKDLPNNYVLLEGSDFNGIELSYKLDKGGYLGTVMPSVYEIGYNDSFIIAKRHPSEWGFFPDTSITEYYVIPLGSKINRLPERNVYGPLSEEEFLKLRVKLGISDTLLFSNKYEKWI